jgi:predicted dehydrogenase
MGEANIMIKIGVVNIDTSHPRAFSEYLKKENRAKYTAIFNNGFRGDDEVEAFMESNDIATRCKSIDELVDDVDIGFIQDCNWDKHLNHAIPFLNKNKPVFIDKPIVGNLKDCLMLEQLSEKGKIILGSSSVRYSYEIVDFLARPEEDRGKIMNIYGTAGVDEFNYAIHIVEAISEIAGAPADTARFVGRSQAEGKVCETFFVEYQNGVTATYNTFHGVWMPFELVIMTTKGTFQFRIDTSKIYGALLDRVCDYMETGKNTLAPVSDITDSIRIMLAARISREKEGITVPIEKIPYDDPGYDGYKFEKEYAEKAAVIYVK